jgi:hypothetical protein
MKRNILTAHTVTTDDGRIVAGWLVRRATSRKEVGHVWQEGAVWKWRAAGSAFFGERSSERAAVEACSDSYDATHGVPLSMDLPFTPAPTDADILEAWRSVEAQRPDGFVRHTTAAPRTAPAKPAAPAEPVRHVEWKKGGHAFDVTAAMAASLRGKK